MRSVGVMNNIYRVDHPILESTATSVRWACQEELVRLWEAEQERAATAQEPEQGPAMAVLARVKGPEAGVE